MRRISANISSFAVASEDVVGASGESKKELGTKACTTLVVGTLNGGRRLATSGVLLPHQRLFKAHESELACQDAG